MNEVQSIELLKGHVENLSREKDLALQALQAASALGQFESSFARMSTPIPILMETATRIEAMFPLADWAFFLVDEATQDFTLTQTGNRLAGFDPEAEIEALIADHSFAYALNATEPSFFTATDGVGRLVLHPLASPSRVRGMFLGRLTSDEGAITDTSRALGTIVMNACAQALESYVLYQHLAATNAELERKVEERTRQLRDSADQMRLILDSIQAGVVVIDAENNLIVDINPAAARLTGQLKEDVVGKTCFETLCPAQRGDCPILDRGQEVNSVERVLCGRDDRRIPILKTAVLATLRGKRVVVESFVDLTEQKKLAQLREDVERITRHDLKSPLTGIIGLPDILLDELTLTDEQREIVLLIKNAGIKMLDMINLSLDLYKMETGTYQLRPLPVDIQGVLSTACAELGQMAARRKVRLVTRGPGGTDDPAPTLILGEELLLFSVLSNLIKNALEASAPGDTVDIVLDGAADRTVSLTVHNPGVIPENIRSRFFEKYATSKDGGTGLGAYSARLMTEAMGGQIRFETSPEHGTSLIVTLPAATT